jgi:hypothetical protein
MLRRIVVVATCVLSVVFMTTVSYASESEVLLKLLLKKGIITQAEYGEVINEIKGPGSLEHRVQDVEKKADEIADQQEKTYGEQKAFKEHVDRHIIHAKEVMPTVLGGLTIGGGVTMVGQATLGNDDNDPPKTSCV